MEIEVRDLTIHYEEAGSGMPFLILHGMPGNGRATMPFFEPLFANRPGWRRIYPDLLDFGTDTLPDWFQGLDSVVDLLVAFMEAVAPGERFAIYGGSWGGYVIRGVVQRRLKQINGVLLSNPVVVWDLASLDLPAQQTIYHDPEMTAALKPEEAWISGLFVAESLAALNFLRAEFLPYMTNPHPAVMARLGNGGFTFDPDALPEPCPAPTLIITGRQDSVVGYNEAWSLLDNFPRASLVVLDRAGHLLGVEQADLQNTLISEWLDRVEEYAAQG